MSTPIINEASEAFMFRYLNTNAPVGFETSGQKVWLDYVKPYIHHWDSDNYGTVYGVINPDKPFKVVIEAHADEIAWYVNHITEDGFLYVVRNGGSDHMITPSKRVKIFTKNGIVKGVFGFPAIHIRNGKDANFVPSMENITIDVGAKNKEEVVNMGIHVGCVAVFEDELTVLNNGRYYCGRALDNRMGGFCIAEVARLLHESKIELPYSLYIVNSVQEEVGLRGAEMIANTIKPHVAIVTDVTHDTCTPQINTKLEGEVKCGNGPSLSHAPSVHNKLLQLIIEAAEEKSIPFQREAASRTTGTDTDAFAYSNKGVPSALISIPLRYMHTTVEMAHKDDIENVIRLFYETLMKIQDGHNFKYF